MKRRTTLIVVAVAAGAILIGLLAWLFIPRSQEAIANDCATFVAEMDGSLHADDPRPGACEGLNEDDYSMILMAKVLRDEEFVDENGDVNYDKLLEE